MRTIRTRFPAFLLASFLLSPLAQAHLTEQTKLLASDGKPGDQFGAAVAMTSAHAVVGAPLHSVAGTQGAVYVFERNSNTSWPQIDKLTPTGAGPLDLFGAELAIAGSYIAVCAPKASADAGAVYMFLQSGSTWSQVQVLTASDTAAGHSFGRSISMDGDAMVIGAPGNEAAYVFRLVAGSWVEEQKLTRAGGVAGDIFGISVSVHGDEIVVGAPGDDTDDVDAGSVYLFELSGAVWSETLRFGSLTPGVGDGFGYSAAIGSEYLAVGAPFDDDFGTDSGAAHRFLRTGPGSWTSQGVLTAPAAPTFADDNVGLDIVTDTNIILVSQPGGDLQGAESGGVQIFTERVGSFFGDVMFPTDTEAGDGLGSSIGIAGCWMISGAPRDDDLGETSGSAYVFLDAHVTQLYCLPGISAAGCVATLSATGTASASEPSGFTVTASGVDGGINGLFFYGINGGQQVSWGNGTSFQCVVPPVIRMGTITSVGPASGCLATFTQDFNATWCSTCPLPAKNPGPSTEIYFQLWYRDPQNTSNQSTSLSNAGSAGICP